MNQTKILYDLFLKYHKISTDSRGDVFNSIFFALSGENFDGNGFAATAISKGARLAVVDKKEYFKDSNYLLVDNTLKALQNLAKMHRKQFKIPVIGITGTNGKTTTKELISAVLSSKKNTLSTEGNLNNHIGVPLTLLKITKNNEIAVIEMGANHREEIKNLCKLAEPNYGLITNIGKAHLEGFGSFNGIVDAKKELYYSIAKKQGLIFVNADDKLLTELSNGMKVLRYGTENADITGRLIEIKPFLTISFENSGKTYPIHTHLYGTYNFNNIMAAVAIGIYFGISPENIINAIENHIPQNNRSQIIKTKTNTLILDAYNANPSSMTEALKNFANYQFDKPIPVLGDMYELGKESEKEHVRIIKLVKELGFEKAIFVGNTFYKLTIPESYLCFQNTENTALSLENNKIEKSTLLIKGSRVMHMEQLVKYL